jgi:hypothetical protein
LSENSTPLRSDCSSGRFGTLLLKRSQAGFPSPLMRKRKTVASFQSWAASATLEAHQ